MVLRTTTNHENKLEIEMLSTPPSEWRPIYSGAIGARVRRWPGRRWAQRTVASAVGRRAR